jgi:6-phosphogluconate dehydrogenase
VQLGIPVPALSASLSYFDAYRSAQLPQNLTQAQRDFFGAHTYQRIDRPDAGFVHSDWAALTSKSAPPSGGKK